MSTPEDRARALETVRKWVERRPHAEDYQILGCRLSEFEPAEQIEILRWAAEGEHQRAASLQRTAEMITSLERTVDTLAKEHDRAAEVSDTPL